MKKERIEIRVTEKRKREMKKAAKKHDKTMTGYIDLLFAIKNPKLRRLICQKR